MSKSSASSLSEAIEKLETAGTSKAQDFKAILEKDYHEVRKALDEIKPHLQELKSKVENEVKQAKHHVEDKVKENPWVAMGIVGLVAFVIGLILGHSRRD